MSILSTLSYCCDFYIAWLYMTYLLTNLIQKHMGYHVLSDENYIRIEQFIQLPGNLWILLMCHYLINNKKRVKID